MITDNTLPVDPVLPHLPLALDGAAMADVFGRLVQAHRPELSVEACAVDRVKYRPRRNMAVSYRLRLRDARSEDLIEQRVATRFCAAGESERRHASALRRTPVTTAAGPATSHVAALDMVAAWWPNDPKLAGGAALLGGPGPVRQRVVREVLAALTGGHGDLVSHELNLMQVVPEDRACARVDLAFRTAPSEPVQCRTVYAKADVHGHGSITHAVMLALRQSEAQVDGRLLTPRPILWLGDCGLHWQAALPGAVLLDVSPQVDAAASLKVGEMLAGLHSACVPAAQRIGLQGLQQRLTLVADTLVTVEPRWESDVRALAGVLAAGVDRAGVGKHVTLHGDLHPRNILVAGDRLGLIDLDNVRHGPAVADLGDWIADALYRALLEGHGVAKAVTACRAFLRAYERAARHSCAEPAVAWSTANSLFCQRAWRSVVNLKPGRYALVEPLLAMAARIARAGSIDAAMQPPHRLAA